MDDEFVRFSERALWLRETINIAITVFLPILGFLFARHVYRAWSEGGRIYRSLTRPQKGIIGLAIMCAGEAIRSGTVWDVLHSKGRDANYLSDYVPLMFSLVMITVGALCAMRNFTPLDKWWGGHRLWVGSLFLFLGLVVANWTVFS